MTLPTDITLKLLDKGEKQANPAYVKELVGELQDMYENIAENVNGFIRNSNETDQAQWTPTLNGSTPGTFTYDRQVGWSVRQGIFTHVWFDIKWTATTAAGYLYLELPYKVTLSDSKPFIGVVLPASISYGAGYTNMVMQAIPDTYRGAFIVTGSGLGYNTVSVPASGIVSGHISYIGIEDE